MIFRENDIFVVRYRLVDIFWHWNDGSLIAIWIGDPDFNWKIPL